MKKILFILFLLVALAGVGFSMFNLGNKDSFQIPTTSPTAAVKGVSIVSFEGEEYSFATVKVTDASRLKLLPNFSEQKTSEEIINEGICRNLVNGGFYSEKFSPIGLFISEREEI